MAYDRYDPRNPRDDRPRWSEDRDYDRNRTRDRDERGFFERAGDEIASWFGDDDAEHRRRDEQRMSGRDEWNRDRRDRSFGEPDRADDDRIRSYGRDARSDRDYRPLAGDYGRSERIRSSFDDRTARDRGEGRDYRFVESSTRPRDRDFDPHYRSWRQRQIDDLDRDYDEYRRENQSRFENDFGSWRERRQAKRGLLSRIREHMEVVGNDDQHVGTIDRVAGDRVILAKSDPESGGVHHSLSCSDIDRVDGDRVVLDCSSEQARQRWRDESRSRALFEREDQGEMGDRVLDRSFSGTYR